MKTFIEFQEQLTKNYTDYKAPSVQAAHARGMASASRMRQTGMNATTVDPKDTAADNISGGIAKPLAGTKIRSGVGKGFKVGDAGVKIEQWYANPTNRVTKPNGNTETTFTTPSGTKQVVKQTQAERDTASRLHNQSQKNKKPGEKSLF
tara:strand:+ start:109 stop:555 length:447 start_codon:yes stop_codon:yes gene_type:complete